MALCIPPRDIAPPAQLGDAEPLGLKLRNSTQNVCQRGFRFKLLCLQTMCVMDLRSVIIMLYQLFDDFIEIINKRKGVEIENSTYLKYLAILQWGVRINTYFGGEKG